MFNPHNGIVYETGEEIKMQVNPPVMHKFCMYNHGWVLVQIYAKTGTWRRSLDIQRREEGVAW